MSRYDAELLVAQGYAMCNDTKPTNNDESSNEASRQSLSAVIRTRNNTRKRRLKTDVDSGNSTATECSTNSSTNSSSSSSSSISNNSSISNGVINDHQTGRCLRSRTARNSDPTAPAPAAAPQVKSQGRGMRLRNQKTLVENGSNDSSDMVDTLLPVVNVGNNSAKSDSNHRNSSDVYEFNESDSESRSASRRSRSRSRSGSGTKEDMQPVSTGTSNRTQSPPPSHSSQLPTVVASPSGRLKLTLRMKRSPVLDEVIESGSSMDPEKLHQRLPPVYEVLRLEGLSADEHEPTDGHHHGGGRKKIRRMRRNSPSRETTPERGERHLHNPLPTTKRLRLIFGNESRTIDLPPNVPGFSSAQ